jgi:hypothetical protein
VSALLAVRAMPRARIVVLAACWALAACAAGCDGGVPPTDAGLDAGEDAGRDAGPPDAGPMCEPVCEGPDSCCADGAGGGVCTNVALDIENCGLCGIDCVASGRGDACQASQCSCGDFLLGCIGNSESTCCAAGGREPHCANIVRDRLDCGACGNECDVMRANRCDALTCVCGDTRGQCAGTPTDLCCADRFERYDCVDTTSDREHCGACANRCTAGMTCVAGTCV